MHEQDYRQYNPNFYGRPRRRRRRFPPFFFFPFPYPQPYYPPHCPYPSYPPYYPPSQPNPYPPYYYGSQYRGDGTENAMGWFEDDESTNSED